MEVLIRIKDELKRLKNKKLKHTAKYMYKRLGLTANYLTFLSFTCGIIATYYLFQNHLIFIVFILLSLVFDILDGAVAQIDHSDAKGWWLDLASDRSITLLILLKTFLFFRLRVILPTIVLYLLTVGLIAYATTRLQKEAKYVLNIWLFYGLFLFQFYREGVYALLIFLAISLIWVMGQMRDAQES